MDEQELMDLYGLEPEEDPAEESVSEEAKEANEAEETAEGELEEVSSASAEDAHGEEQPTPPSAVQTREERARHAAARRKAETEAAINKAVAEETARVDAAIKAVGIPNPNNGGKPFASLQEIEEYKRSFDDQARTSRMANGNTTPEDIRAIVSEMPEVKAAVAAAEKARAAEEAADRAAFERDVADQLQQIHALDPSVNTLEDILASDTAEAFVKAVREHRMNYYDAFRFVNMDKLAAVRQENARREEAARHEGKSHLKATTSRGNSVVDVPAAEMALYKQLMPEATEAEIRRHYRQYKK